MKLKVFFAALALCVTTSVYAGDAPKLKDGVDTDAKAAIEAAQVANKEAKAQDREWWWLRAIDGMWTGSAQTNSKIINQAIEMANEGKNAEAIKVAKFIEMSAKAAVEQSKIGEKAGPSLYGF